MEKRAVVAAESEISKEDASNGWTKESLARYQKERDKINYETIANPKVNKPTRQTSYNPLRWRE